MNRFDLVLRGGTVVTAADRFPADIGVFDYANEESFYCRPLRISEGRIVITISMSDSSAHRESNHDIEPDDFLGSRPSSFANHTAIGALMTG